MRDIRFRAWYKGSEKFGKHMLDHAFAITHKGIFLSHLASDEYTQNDYRPEEIVVMQFTGLTDRHGKEIYEGDIVQSGKLGAPFAVEWGDIDNDHPDEDFVLGVGFQLFEPHRNQDAGGYEVIGNIYSNPELLK